MRKLFLLLFLLTPVFCAAQSSMNLNRGTFPVNRTVAYEDEENKNRRPRNTIDANGQEIVPVMVDGSLIYVPRNKTLLVPDRAAPVPQEVVPARQPNAIGAVEGGGPVRFRRRPDMPASLRGWPCKALGIEGSGLTGAGVNIALFDSGVSPNHELNGKVDVLDATGGQNPSDFLGHGTAIAGILVGGGAKSRLCSVAPGARVKSYKITYEEKIAGGAVETKTNNTFIQKAVASVLEHNKLRPNNTIDIINISYGLSDQNKFLEDALFQAYNSGITIVAAAGNDSGAVRYPAAYGFVIGVGAISPEKQLFPYSNYGPQVNFVAPGESIFAISHEGGYMWLDGGTSYSAAYVSGVAALIIQAWKAKHGSKPSPQQVYETLQKISSPLPSVQAGRQGHGLPDVSKIPAVI